MDGPARSGSKPGGTKSRAPSVAPNGEAFRLATKWVEEMAAELDESARRDLEQREQEAQREWASLGVFSAPHQEFAHAGPATNASARAPPMHSRPQRVGLGAKFLPQSQVSPELQALEKQLKSRLSRQLNGWDHAEGGSLKQDQGGRADTSSEDEAEGSRATAIQRKTKSPHRSGDLSGRHSKKRRVLTD